MRRARTARGDAAYLPHLDGIPAGGLENWRDGKGWESWRFDIGRALTPAAHDALGRKAEAASDRPSSPKGDIVII